MGEEGDAREVTLSKAIWIFDTPCTQAVWTAVMGDNPSHFVDPDLQRPVEQVSWEDVQEFMDKLNVAANLSLRLPTEAEWEYCCRAGTKGTTYAGEIKAQGQNNAPNLDPIAWYGGNCGVGFDLEKGWDMGDWEKQYDFAQGGTRKVGLKQPNKWGLYDMLGNVWEWCQNWHGPYEFEQVVDPQGPGKGHYRVMRGGSWASTAQVVRSAYRGYVPPVFRDDGIGFRCAQVQASAEPRGGGRPPGGAQAAATTSGEAAD